MSPAGYILSVWSPIGHTEGIFSVSGILLVTRRVYSQCLVLVMSMPLCPFLWQSVAECESRKAVALAEAAYADAFRKENPPPQAAAVQVPIDN
jgi:hypothetical protein